MIPVSKATMKTVSRFPELYKRQAIQVIEQEKSKAIRSTANAFLMATMIVLVEEFGFGTTANSTKLLRFRDALQNLIDASSDYYSDAVVEGLHNRLHNLGIEYNLD